MHYRQCLVRGKIAIIIGLFEIIPLFFGALLGPWAGCLVGGGGFAIGAFISLHFGNRGLAVYTYSDSYLIEGGYWFLSVYYAVIGFTAGLAFSRTRGRYETLYNIAVAEVFGFMGAALAFLFASVSLDARFQTPFELELIPFLATFPSLVLFPLLLVLWEKLKIAYSSLKIQW